MRPRCGAVLAMWAAALAATATAAGAAALPPQAQEAWPLRPVRFVVPSSPGGGTDTYARLITQALGETLKQQFVVENRPGGSGNIGTAIVAKAAGDGYTFLLSANAAIAVNPSLYRNLPFDIDRDFAPVTRGVTSPMVICVQPESGLRTLADLLDRARAQPARLAFGSAGNGSPTFLGVKMIEEAAGVRFLHVPYKGVGPAYQGLLGGELSFLFPDLASALPYIKGGRLAAIVANQRSALLPGVPTLADAGFGGLILWGSFSVLAPAGTPVSVVRKLNAEIGRAMREPALAEKLERQALVPVFDTPEEFALSLRSEREHWAEVIRRSGIAAED